MHDRGARSSHIDYDNRLEELMGLAVSTCFWADLLKNDEEGAAWFEKNLQSVNRVLAEAGLPPHVEPREYTVNPIPHCSSFPYSFIHYLRRAFAHTRKGAPAFTPAPTPLDPDDPLTDAELSGYMDSHLVCHSDCEGFYVPQDFSDILYGKLPGAMLGSSYALLRELLAVAPLLEIPVDGDEITEATARALCDTPDNHPYRRERVTWGALYAAAKWSIHTKSLLVFN